MALNILQIEKARQNFYAPAFNVLVAGQSLVLDLQLEVDQRPGRQRPRRRRPVHVRRSTTPSTSPRREFLKVGGKTLPEFFEFGSPVEISMGYGDRTKLDLDAHRHRHRDEHELSFVGRAAAHGQRLSTIPTASRRARSRTAG